MGGTVMNAAPTPMTGSTLVITEASKEQAKKELTLALGDYANVLEEAAVQELMINHGNAIFVERNGVVTRSKQPISPARLDEAITLIANINQGYAGYIFDGDLPGLRVAAVRSPIAINGACMSIRKHGIVTRRINEYRDNGSFSPSLKVNRVASKRPSNDRIAKGGQGVVEFFKWMLLERANFIVSGPTSSGKTTFLNSLLALLADIDPNRRVLTFEDTRELVNALKNHVAFLSKAEAGVTPEMLLKVGMRFKPDCMWLGETRGKEAYVLLKAASTGHPGSACSLHADDGIGALGRLAELASESPEGANLSEASLQKKIANTFQFVIHCERVGKVRTLMEIVEVHGVDGGEYKTSTLFKKELEFV
jgi:pilus assembly protein CpaF